ncbi:putative iron-regulated membrane protein [Lewinella marina]|uniref:DNA mismatch repair protein n=1 Tax=Neolewinella marina TaxID=438751 RepID=A0A2G0CD15_9BACT|nr:PepSY-associated TM helix domain-containing protein [Neolewinella marina]NJB86938.1 putative iron-regulated membrane protein [Neolewinella marina]PHK97866.1 DNA mismatch repair protein [Neolewinella marina]
MPKKSRRKRQARILRQTRRIHRWSGITLFVFFFVIGVTSVLLGWKKDSSYIMPATARGSSTELAEWLPTAELLQRAQVTLSDSLGPAYTTTIDRIDYRPDKGSLKFLFKDHYGEVQLDGATGAVLSVGIRRADFIEQIHDGSIVSDLFKLIYSTVMGLATIVFTVSGFWLWYGPRRMRR